jgi:hypothetical protein
MNVSLDLNSQQRELLVEGLRHVRSARKYEFREASDAPDPRRANDLQAISDLMVQLEGKSASAPAPR